MSPSPAATPDPLVRRLSYLLTGLPPTPEETREMAASANRPGVTPETLREATDHFLASPQNRSATPCWR